MPATIASAARPYAAELLPPRGAFLSVAVATSGNTQVGWTGDDFSTRRLAILWNGTSENYIYLHPAGFDQTYAQGIWENTQVGYGQSPATGGASHALMWMGTASSVIDLHPSGFSTSWALDIEGTRQIGGGTPIGSNLAHALLWTPSSVVDLNPSGFDQSGGRAIRGNTQVGSGRGAATGDKDHALLWNGTAESVVDLHPAGFDSSYATGLAGTRQVGWGFDNMQRPRALLWNGTAESAIDLTPPGYEIAGVGGASGSFQVGSGRKFFGDIPRALLWEGSVDSVTDLHVVAARLVPDIGGSEAIGVDERGNVVGWVNRGFQTQAILWYPIPEPSALALLSGGLLGIVTLQRRRNVCRRGAPEWASNPGQTSQC